MLHEKLLYGMCRHQIFWKFANGSFKFCFQYSLVFQLCIYVSLFIFVSEIKERIKKTKDEKKAKKAEVTSKQKSSKSNVPKGAAPKGPKIGGGGGKR